MEVDRQYNACKALDPQIDNEDDIHHSSPDYEINERELQTQMWLGGLHGCNEWVARTGRSGFSGGLHRTRRNTGLGELGGLGRTGAEWGRRGELGDWRTQRTTESCTGRIGVDGAD